MDYLALPKLCGNNATTGIKALERLVFKLEDNIKNKPADPLRKSLNEFLADKNEDNHQDAIAKELQSVEIKQETTEQRTEYTVEFKTCPNSNKEQNTQVVRIEPEIQIKTEGNSPCQSNPLDYRNEQFRGCSSAVKISQQELQLVKIKQEPIEQRTEYAVEFESTQIMTAQNTQTMSPASFDDIVIKESDVKKEISELSSLVLVVINLERSVFYNENFVCGVCMRIFASLFSLQMHKSTHVESKFISDANKMTINMDPRKNRFECDECNYKSALRFNLKRHKLAHTGEKPFECDECKLKFISLSNLKKHKLFHAGVKAFKCDLCDYSAVLQSTLKIHNLSHNGEKRFECDKCNYKSVTLAYLKRHTLTHTLKKPFHCDLCDYRSVRRSDLKRHKYKHTTEKPFKCDLCDYRSPRRIVLKKHMLSHAGGKSVVSNLCNDRSVRSSD